MGAGEENAMKIVEWVKGKLSDYLHPDAERSYPPIDAEFDDEPAPEEPAVSLRFRVTTTEVPATADAPKRASTVYYVYGQTQEQAVGRLPAAILIDAKVESAGRIEGGVLRFSEDERWGEIVDDRVAPGTPGPVK